MAASKKTKGKPRTVYCVVTGKPIEYCGFGRPPKYHPDVKAQMLAEQRKKARANQKAKRTAERRASKVDAESRAVGM